MLTIDRSAEAEVAAPPARCLERLADVERYPSWASLISGAERDGDRVRLRAGLLGVQLVMDCALELGSDRAVLRRLPYSADDDERYEASWRVMQDGSGSRVALHVVAALDVPGPARLVRARIERRLVDDLLADFARSFQPST
jgi:polyketide cyclase/dehydrase/lipid transport protein